MVPGEKPVEKVYWTQEIRWKNSVLRRISRQQKIPSVLPV
jgi:hypothetical protein